MAWRAASIFQNFIAPVNIPFRGKPSTLMSILANFLL
jgi:hypothetical protein